jgi:class 3 adenylate cyclase
VHCGSVIAGVVETSKVSYDVFGGAMKVLLALLRDCADGDVVASDATRRLAGETFGWAAIAGASSDVRVHRLHAQTAAPAAVKA